jgi:hypothetical protein
MWAFQRSYCGNRSGYSFSGFYTTDRKRFTQLTGVKVCDIRRDVRRLETKLGLAHDANPQIYNHYSFTPFWAVEPLHLKPGEPPHSISNHIRSLGEVTGNPIVLVYTFANNFGNARALLCDVPPKSEYLEAEIIRHQRRQLLEALLR